MQLDYLLVRSQDNLVAHRTQENCKKLSVIEERGDEREEGLAHAEGPGNRLCCGKRARTRLTAFHEIKHTWLHRPDACFKPGAPLSDHIGLLLSLVITHTPDTE